MECIKTGRSPHDHTENWLNERKREFLDRYPEGPSCSREDEVAWA
jgi:hypothetical protein